MCQLCALKDLATRDRWPKPLEPHKSDIVFLATSAHDQYTTASRNIKIDTNSGNETIRASEGLLELLRLLHTLLNDVEADREKWWTSPAKREMRKKLELECDQMKLSELHKINNRMVECLEAMNAKLGLFVKWSLGMNGGVWELVESAKVQVKEESSKVAVESTKI